MKVLRNLCIGALAIWLTPFALADRYDDLAAKGYRWVTVDGPYAYFSRDDLPFWTLSRFPSVRPITDLDGTIETPLEWGTTLKTAQAGQAQLVHAQPLVVRSKPRVGADARK